MFLGGFMPQSNITSEKVYLKINELADYIRCGQSTIHKHVKLKNIPAPRKVCGILLFKKSEIDNWLESKKQQ